MVSASMTEARPASEPDDFDVLETVLGSEGEKNDEGADVPRPFELPSSYVQSVSEGGEPQFLAKLRKLAHCPVE